jgi:hypothetical protein
MCKLRRALHRTAALMVLGLATLPALATWGPFVEYGDIDSNGPASFSFYSAGIYDPALRFIGYVNWQDDTSDTIYFSIGDQGSAGYTLEQFQTTYWTWPSVGSGQQGLHLLLRPAASSSQPLLSLDLVADASGHGGITDNTLRLNSGQLYALTISTVGSTDSGSVASYSLVLSIADPVPEPPSWALLLSGAAMLALAIRHRNVPTSWAALLRPHLGPPAATPRRLPATA